MNRILCLVASSLLIQATTIPSARAQLPQVDDSRLGVDSLRLVGGTRFYGFLLSKNPDRSLNFAVERAWLESTHPELYAKQVQAELDSRGKSQELLVERIRDWMKARSDDQQLVGYLQSQLHKIESAETEAHASTRFTVMEFTSDQVQELKIAPAANRKIAGLAYSHQLGRIVQTPASILRRQLEKQNVDVVAEQVDLSADVPSVRIESDRQWAARKALVEFQLRESLEYQGTATTLLRKGEENADVGTLLGQMLGGNGGGLDAISQLGADLGLPEFKPRPDSARDWWKKVTREAEADGFIGVLITRMNQSISSPNVTVENWFFAKESAGKWFPVVRMRSTSSTANQTQARIDRIKQDPQIQSITDALSGLGFQVGNQLDQALRHGAATQEALEDANSEFYLFLSRQIRALDGPPITLFESP